MKPGGQTQTTTVDPATQAYVNQLRQTALGYAGIGQQGAQAPDTRPSWFQQFAPRPLQGNAPPLPQGITDAQNQFNQYAQGGNLGFSALTGNAAAAQQFMNPYTATLDPYFAQQRALAVQGANDQATQMGAFGGDRSQIGAAVAGSQADQLQAAYRMQAFNDAMQRAGYAANLGYGAGAQAAFLPQQYAAGQLGLLNQGLGPYGQTQTTQMQNDPFSQLLGLGLTAGGFLLGGPAGAAAGSQVMGSFGGGNNYG